MGVSQGVCCSPTPRAFSSWRGWRACARMGQHVGALWRPPSGSGRHGASRLPSCRCLSENQTGFQTNTGLWFCARPGLHGIWFGMKSFLLLKMFVETTVRWSRACPALRRMPSKLRDAGVAQSSSWGPHVLRGQQEWTARPPSRRKRD